MNVARACIRAALYDAFRDGLVDVNEAARVPKLDERGCLARAAIRYAFADWNYRAVALGRA